MTPKGLPSPRQLADYLKATGWTDSSLLADRGLHHFSNPAHERREMVFPDAPGSYDDTEDTLWNIVRKIAEIERTDSHEMIGRIVGASAEATAPASANPRTIPNGTKAAVVAALVLVAAVAVKSPFMATGEPTMAQIGCIDANAFGTVTTMNVEMSQVVRSNPARQAASVMWKRMVASNGVARLRGCYARAAAAHPGFDSRSLIASDIDVIDAAVTTFYDAVSASVLPAGDGQDPPSPAAVTSLSKAFDAASRISIRLSAIVERKGL